MTLVGIVARVVIGIVLLFAGTSKLRSRTWPTLAAEMGTPKPVVIALPAVEALLGLALVLQVGGGLVAWPAVAMFVGFTVFVVRHYVSGSGVPCNCFGASGGEEAIGRTTIVRNVGLVALAVLATF